MQTMESKTLKKSDVLEKALQKAVLLAMENIAFEEPEILAAPVAIEGETISSALQVVSPYLLLTTVTMPKELALKLTRIIYRDDEKEISNNLLDDTVGEFLNTIIGKMMGDLTLGERIFEMGLPEKIKIGKDMPAGHKSEIFFRIEEFPFVIAIYGDIFIES